MVAAAISKRAPGRLRPNAALRSELLTWFDCHRRELPWRATLDPYAIWISEVMLQQTQVSTVIPYWHRFLARFPSVASLASASMPDVLAQWRGLGYYSRARNLHRAANEMVQRFGGQLPATVAELTTLPGFGRYTAGAVASIAFGQPAALVDGNVARVLSRIFEIEGRPGQRARDKVLWGLAEQLVEGERPGDFNQALMELGALICKPENPFCLLCPVRPHCGAFAHHRVDELPPARVRAARKKLELALAVCRRGPAILVARREGDGLFGGLWELPSVELSDTQRAKSVAALKRLLGAASRVGEEIGTLARTLTHRDLVLHLYQVRRPPHLPALAGYSELRWTTRSEVDALGMSTAMQRAIELAWSTERE